MFLLDFGFYPSPLPLSHKGRGEEPCRKIFIELTTLQFNYLFIRTQICSLSLDGRGLGRGCLAFYYFVAS
jgi:hypothetical protein